ncbi:hypothetical protein C7S18_12060 [Ahniella affigens]|uniref:DUF2189 domain-containing protein n=1 Tax=Ahniella affigens TaxID=2021234 RepID=A0A2P1PSR6_9GAMM|nr:BPSS1780 family membrane protein [Ahniella affigens]AVP97886.1 hypothetical protein C7S18_12060 [Ahniella affigens]
MTDNPYSAPLSRVDPSGGASVEGFNTEPLARGPGAAVSWISKGWTLFSAASGAWATLGGVMIGALLVLIVVSLIPILGSLIQMAVNFAITFLMPAFLAGLYMSADRLNRGEPIVFDNFFDGFRKNLGQLVMVGVLNFAASLVMIVVLLIIFGIGIGVTVGFSAIMNNQEPEISAGLIIFIIFAVFIAMALSFVIYMAFWFAPMLVAINGMTAVDAVKLSFKAAMKNVGGFILFAIMASFAVFIAYIPCLLGLIVVGPVFACANYSAYREIFYGD